MSQQVLIVCTRLKYDSRQVRGNADYVASKRHLAARALRGPDKRCKAFRINVLSLHGKLALRLGKKIDLARLRVGVAKAVGRAFALLDSPRNCLVISMLMRYSRFRFLVGSSSLLLDSMVGPPDLTPFKSATCRGSHVLRSSPYTGSK
jgi:hypothetical protein